LLCFRHRLDNGGTDKMRRMIDAAEVADALRERRYPLRGTAPTTLILQQFNGKPEGERCAGSKSPACASMWRTSCARGCGHCQQGNPRSSTGTESRSGIVASINGFRHLRRNGTPVRI
jgi:hypothetical protein